MCLFVVESSPHFLPLNSCCRSSWTDAVPWGESHRFSLFRCQICWGLGALQDHRILHFCITYRPLWHISQQPPLRRSRLSCPDRWNFLCLLSFRRGPQVHVTSRIDSTLVPTCNAETWKVSPPFAHLFIESWGTRAGVLAQTVPWHILAHLGTEENCTRNSCSDSTCFIHRYCMNPYDTVLILQIYGSIVLINI